MENTKNFRFSEWVDETDVMMSTASLEDISKAAAETRETFKTFGQRKDIGFFWVEGLRAASSLVLMPAQTFRTAEDLSRGKERSFFINSMAALSDYDSYYTGGAALLAYFRDLDELSCLEEGKQNLPAVLKESLAKFGPGGLEQAQDFFLRLDKMAASPFVEVIGLPDKMTILDGFTGVPLAVLEWDEKQRVHTTTLSAVAKDLPLAVKDALTKGVSGDVVGTSLGDCLAILHMIETDLAHSFTGGLPKPLNHQEPDWVLARFTGYEYKAEAVVHLPVKETILATGENGGVVLKEKDRPTKEFPWAGAGVAAYQSLVRDARYEQDIHTMAPTNTGFDAVERVPAEHAALARGVIWGGEKALQNNIDIHMAINKAIEAGLGVEDLAEDGSRITLTNGTGRPLAAFVFEKTQMTVTSEGETTTIGYDFPSFHNNDRFRSVRELLEFEAKSDAVRGPRLGLELKHFLDDLSELKDLVRASDGSKLASIGERSLALVKTATILKEGYNSLEDRGQKPEAGDWAKVIYWANMAERDKDKPQAESSATKAAGHRSNAGR